MKKISSSLTILYKKVFPVFWFGLLAIFLGVGLMAEGPNDGLMLLLVPLLMAIIGYVVMRKLVWDLVDEVYDCGDFLIVRNRGEEERIALTDISSVAPATFWNPPRITLRLAKAGKHGADVTFSPVPGMTINPFAPNAVAEDLVRRVNRRQENPGP